MYCSIMQKLFFDHTTIYINNILENVSEFDKPLYGHIGVPLASTFLFNLGYFLHNI